jgi:hypothetical protein
MKRIKEYLLIGTGAVVLVCSLMLTGSYSAHAGGGPDVCINPTCNAVQVANAASNPVAVTEIDRPEKRAFQATVTVTLNQGFEGQNGFVPVPAGKRLVIEFASARGNVPAGQTMVFMIVTNLNGENNGEFHHLPTTQQFTSGNTAQFIMGEQVRIYADSGFAMLRADRNSPDGTASFIFTISGYLIDVP